LSMDIREKVMKAISAECRAVGRSEVRRRSATAVRWAKRVETTGDVAPMKMGGDRRSQRIEAHAHSSSRTLEAQPDVTIMELREKIRERHGVASAMERCGVPGATRDHAQEEDRPRVASRRDRMSPRPRSVVRGTARSRSVEARVSRRDGVSTKHGAPFGWLRAAGRCRMSVPFGHWRARRSSRRCVGSHRRADDDRRALDGAAFLAYVEQVLAPTLSAGETC